jgi:hypothetical protein
MNDEWDKRLERAVAETLRRRRARKAERQELAERRNHGLRARHTAKLARIQQQKEQS